MKQLLLTITVLALLHVAQPGQAQVGIQVNIGVQPQWGPTGYDYAEYYYLPDIDVYYNIPSRQFVYLNAGRWTFAASLPVYYRSYDLYRGYKVVINDRDPYRRCDYYRGEYGRYKGYHGRQVVIRDSPRPRYSYDRRDRYEHRDYDRRDHGRYNDRKWDNDHGRDNDHDRGNGNGHRKHHH
jgi:hypothetical protein